MNIGALSITPPTVLAPLAGITHLPFRLVAKAYGCGLVYSEMVSASGLWHGSQKTVQLMDSDCAERPLAIQIFGSDPDILAHAARRVETAGADIVDINFGCSVKKVLKTGSGAALMDDLDLAGRILQAVKGAIAIPLTIKMRTGWQPDGRQAMALGELAQDCGVAAVALHPRTAQQGFGGRSDWRLIKALQKRLTIPVIGNGDILTADDALRMMSETGCQAVMIGRAAMAKPWIFRQVAERLAGRPESPVGLGTHFDIMREYTRQAVAYFGEDHGCRIMRGRLSCFVKGLPHSTAFRRDITHLENIEEALKLISAYETRLEQMAEGTIDPGRVLAGP
jgi:tRNA-dihydrouridine synthase B